MFIPSGKLLGGRLIQYAVFGLAFFGGGRGIGRRSLIELRGCVDIELPRRINQCSWKVRLGLDLFVQRHIWCVLLRHGSTV